MNSFRRGLRNGTRSCSSWRWRSSSGASRHSELVHERRRTAIAAEHWERNSTDDYMDVSWKGGPSQHAPADQPLVVLVAGSSGREAIASGTSLAAEVKADGGPGIVAYNLTHPGSATRRAARSSTTCPTPRRRCSSA